jgi:hypothetical protein
VNSLPIALPSVAAMAEKPEPDSEDERDRRVTNAFLAVFFIVIVGIGLWLVNAMVDYRHLDDCIAQGRRNCAPIDQPR